MREPEKFHFKGHGNNKIIFSSYIKPGLEILSYIIITLSNTESGALY